MRATIKEAQRDLLGGSIPWFATETGSTSWRRVIQARINKGQAQARFLNDQKSQWKNIDGLSCLVGEGK